MRPAYEESALKAVAEGYTLVEFTVDGRGRVTQPQIIEAVPDERFVKATLSAIRQWRYKPRTVGGEPISTTVRQRFRFRGRTESQLN